MSALMDSNPALFGAVMFHGAAFLPRLRQMKYEDVQKIAEQANQHSLQFPLYMAGPKDRFSVPLWQEEKMSGAQVLALMVFALYVLCGEDDQKAAPLLRSWPIHEAKLLCTKNT
jgi:hypothetical protein